MLQIQLLIIVISLEFATVNNLSIVGDISPSGTCWTLRHSDSNSFGIINLTFKIKETLIGLLADMGYNRAYLCDRLLEFWTKLDKVV